MARLQQDRTWWCAGVASGYESPGAGCADAESLSASVAGSETQHYTWLRLVFSHLKKRVTRCQAIRCRSAVVWFLPTPQDATYLKTSRQRLLLLSKFCLTRNTDSLQFAPELQLGSLEVAIESAEACIASATCQLQLHQHDLQPACVSTAPLEASSLKLQTSATPQSATSTARHSPASLKTG